MTKQQRKLLVMLGRDFPNTHKVIEELLKDKEYKIWYQKAYPSGYEWGNPKHIYFDYVSNTLCSIELSTYKDNVNGLYCELLDGSFIYKGDTKHGDALVRAYYDDVVAQRNRDIIRASKKAIKKLFSYYCADYDFRLILPMHLKAIEGKYEVVEEGTTYKDKCYYPIKEIKELKEARQETKKNAPLPICKYLIKEHWDTKRYILNNETWLVQDLIRYCQPTTKQLGMAIKVINAVKTKHLRAQIEQQEAKLWEEAQEEYTRQEREAKK